MNQDPTNAIPPAEPWSDLRGQTVAADFAAAEAVVLTNVQPAEMGFELRPAPELAPLLKPLADFKLHPENVRKHDIAAIQHSLATYGQQVPLVAQRSTGYICKGNGTYEAAAAMGATQLAISVEDFDDATALGYLLADNRASDNASYEKRELFKALKKLADGPGLTGTLWTADDLDDLAAELDAVTIAEPPDFKGDYFASPEHDAKHASAAEPGVKMHEIPVTLTTADHQVFMAEIHILKAAYGTTGTIATVVEAVKRQAALARAGLAHMAAIAGEPPMVEAVEGGAEAIAFVVVPGQMSLDELAPAEATEADLLERLG